MRTPSQNSIKRPLSGGKESKKMTKQTIKEILEEQLKLLSERSKSEYETSELVQISLAICEITKMLDSF